MADYKIIHDSDKCLKCGLCVAFCPNDCLEMTDAGPKVIDIENCVGCMTCNGNCQVKALQVEALTDAIFDPYKDEKRAPKIDDTLQTQFKEWEEACIEALNLRWKPVAVNLIAKDEALPDCKMPPNNMRFCEALMAARRGASILMPPHKHSCPDGTSIFGMTDVPKKLATGEIYMLFHKLDNKEAAANMVRERPTLPKFSMRATYVAPLSKTVRKPEVVVFTGTREDMMWLTMSMSYYTGERFNYKVSGYNSMCVEAVLYPFLEKQANITLGCYGCRAASDIGEDMMFMGVPIEMMPTVVDGLKELSKKAIPDSRNKIYLPPIM
ncbi:MAG: DUF169 domain-containing protein [Coriobacteriales bacterium]|nr:DUF169 domain-containing protein [Coriobacteriales bacterium]